MWTEQQLAHCSSAWKAGGAAKPPPSKLDKQWLWLRAAAGRATIKQVIAICEADESVDADGIKVQKWNWIRDRVNERRTKKKRKRRRGRWQRR